MNEQLEIMMNELKDKGKEILERELTAFFKKYPHITEFSWRQYTPYFNDGEPCYFGADFYDLFDDEEISVKEFNELYYEASKDLRKCLDSLETIFYQWLFGDHVLVTAKFVDDNVVFEVEEYTDHD